MMQIIERYTTPSIPGSFSGLSGFKKHNKFKSYKELKNYPTYSLHKQVRRNFPRRQTIADYVDEHWQVDLIDVKKFKHQNSHFQYILCCICVLSKYAWVEPIKNKTAQACAEAFEKIFKKGRVPKYIYSDLGNEFKGACRVLFKEYKITPLDTDSVHKASVVERFNRTLKEKMEHFFTDSQSHKYTQVLQDLVDSYNNSIHRAIKMKPAQVTDSNEGKAKENLYGADQMAVENDYHVNFSFKVGDYVRKIVKKALFDKGYAPNWTEEVFIVYFLNPSNPATYKIKTILGEEDDHNYYKEELQRVTPEEFPFDSFEILDKQADKVLVKKLNSENQQEQWIKRVQPKRLTKKNVSNP